MGVLKMARMHVALFEQLGDHSLYGLLWGGMKLDTHSCTLQFSVVFGVIWCVKAFMKEMFTYMNSQNIKKR